MSNWSVVKTRPRWEKKVAAVLAQKGIETFCPVQKARSQWSDRVKTIETPLLKSYVFVKATDDQRTAVRLTEGVINFVYRGGKLVLVKEKLLQSIQQFQDNHVQVEVRELIGPASEESPVVNEQHKSVPSLWIEALNLMVVACLQSEPVNIKTDKR